MTVVRPPAWISYREESARPVMDAASAPELSVMDSCEEKADLPCTSNCGAPLSSVIVKRLTRDHLRDIR